MAWFQFILLLLHRVSVRVSIICIFLGRGRSDIFQNTESNELKLDYQFYFLQIINSTFFENCCWSNISYIKVFWEMVYIREAPVCQRLFLILKKCLKKCLMLDQDRAETFRARGEGFVKILNKQYVDYVLDVLPPSPSEISRYHYLFLRIFYKIFK